MSSSNSKITSVACPKCKQGFKFKRVPKMAAVTCPHCGVEIRLTRKKKKPTSTEQPPVDADSQSSQSPAEAVEEADGFPVIKTRRTRKRVNLDGFKIDPDEPEVASSEGAEPEAEEADGFPVIKTRRPRKRLNLDGIQIGEIEIDPEPPATSVPPSSVTDSLEIKTRRPRKRVKLEEVKLDEGIKPQAPAKSKTDAVPKRRSKSVPKSIADAAEVTKPDVEPPVDLPKLKKRRPRKSVKLDKVQLEEPPKPVVPERRVPSVSEAAVESPKVAEPAVLGKPAVPDEPAAPAPPEDAGAVESKKKDSVDLVEDDSVGEGDPVVDLLPPKFLVADIETNENAVVLPAAGGGTQVVDTSEIRVTHEGRSVTLVVLTPEERARMRLIENILALVIAGIMLAIAVWLVL